MSALAESTAGTLFQGRYELKSTLVSSPTFTVFAAEHVAIERPVEIKTVSAGVEPNSEAAQAILREARAVGAVAHRNVQSVVDTGVDESGAPYVIFEALRGPTLSDLMAQYPDGMPEERALPIMVQMLEALAALHAGGVIHRVLSPDLVRVESMRGGDLVKLTGFADAVFVGEGDQAPPPSWLPSDIFVAPEMLASGNGADPRLDVFASGVILWLMLSAGNGQAPVRDEIRRVVALAAAVDPAERLSSVQELLQAISPFDPTKRGAARADGDGSVEQDLQTLQRRMTTQTRRRGDADASVISHLAVLLTVEAIYKMTQARRWPDFVAKAPAVDALLPSAPGAERFTEHGVPMATFVQILSAADEVLGRGDMAIVAALGQSVSMLGTARLAPNVPEPTKPDDLVRVFPLIWSTMMSDGQVTVLEYSRSRARIAISDQLSPSLEISAWITGLMRGILQATGAMDVEIGVPASQALGDSADVYALSWKL